MCSYLLDIEDLQLIRDILKKSNFDETKWPDLGLSLGLPQPEISSIRAKNTSDPHQCLLDCLTWWLKSKRTLPQILANAIDSLHDTKAADSIRKICKLT